jgi:hypothetical protein
LSILPAQIPIHPIHSNNAMRACLYLVRNPCDKLFCMEKKRLFLKGIRNLHLASLSNFAKTIRLPMRQYHSHTGSAPRLRSSGEAIS